MGVENYSLPFKPPNVRLSRSSSVADVRCAVGPVVPLTCWRVVLFMLGHACSGAHGGCSHDCADGPGGVRCSCPPGLKLSVNGVMCDGELLLTHTPGCVLQDVCYYVSLNLFLCINWLCHPDVQIRRSRSGILTRANIFVFRFFPISRFLGGTRPSVPVAKLRPWIVTPKFSKKRP